MLEEIQKCKINLLSTHFGILSTYVDDMTPEQKRLCLSLIWKPDADHLANQEMGYLLIRICSSYTDDSLVNLLHKIPKDVVQHIASFNP